MRDAFDVLYREGVKGSPKLLSIGAARPADRTAGAAGGLISCWNICAGKKACGFVEGSISPATGACIFLRRIDAPPRRCFLCKFNHILRGARTLP